VLASVKNNEMACFGFLASRLQWFFQMFLNRILVIKENTSINIVLCLAHSKILLEKS
jgi:hypothetical protein